MMPKAGESTPGAANPKRGTKRRARTVRGPRPDVHGRQPSGEVPWPGTTWDDMVVVGRIARTHGLRGHVVVYPETDFPEERFRVGARVAVLKAGSVAELKVATLRLQQGRP